MITAAVCPVSGLFDHPEKLHDDLAHLREQHKTLEFSEKLGAYVVSRYDDIVHVVENPHIFSSRPTVPEPSGFVAEKLKTKCPLRGTLIGLDNPDHDRLRRAVASFFVPRKLERFEPMIERLANELVDEFVAKGEVDIKIAFALPLPLKVVSAVAGLDPLEWAWYGRALALFGGHQVLSEGLGFEDKLENIIKLHEQVADIIQKRKPKENRRHDLISHIWQERDDGVVEMTDFEHLSLIPGLTLAGHETTTNLLSMGLSHLLHQNIWEGMNVDDEARAAALEELLRYESAITGMKREVVVPTKIGGTQLNPGILCFVRTTPAVMIQPIFQMIRVASKSGVLVVRRNTWALDAVPMPV